MTGSLTKIMINCANILAVCSLTACGLIEVGEAEKDPPSTYSTQIDLPFRPPQDRVLVTQHQDMGSEVVVTLLRYSRLIGELNEEDLGKEFEKLDHAEQDSPSQRGKLKLAVLLSMPASRFYDEKRAETVLNQVLKESEGKTPALKEYAHLLLTTLKQRSSFQKMYEDLHKKLQKERTERKQLQQQLEALKSIEKSITTRQK